MSSLSISLPRGGSAKPSRGRAAQRGLQHWQRGLGLAQQQQWAQAAEAFGQATQAQPGDAVFWLNLANAHHRAGSPAAAEDAARRCLALEPGQAVAQQLLGESLARQHRHAEAVAVFAALEASGHAEPDCLLKHANSLMALLRPAEATAVLLRALCLQPERAEAHRLLADCMHDRGLEHEAAECLRTVLALQPDNVEALARLSLAKRFVMNWSELPEDVQRIADLSAAMPRVLPRSFATFALLSLPVDPAVALHAAACESLLQAGGAKPLPALAPAERRPGPVRIGWLSYDFRDHPVSQLLVDVLESMDRSRVTLTLYSTGPDDGTPLRRRVEAAADGFVDLRGVSDALAAERIRADGIDVLVDLMGLTRGTRVGILARKPAPVQVGFLGYPGSTGAGWIDYLVGDPFVTPAALAGQFSEHLAQLPLCFQPNNRSRPLPQPMTRAEAGLPEDAFVICAFNHTYKILPEAFDRWCAVLRRVPQAVLWLKQTNAQLHGNVRREAAARGVDPARVLFAPKVAYADHFSRLALADVFADTWPYNAHTTASDALWAGVPVVTCYGNSYASRVAASVLNAAGLGELAFDNADDYECALLALAEDPALRAAYRQHLQGQRLALPLFDTPRYTRELEALLLRMAQRWQDGLPPAPLLAET